MGVLIAAAQSFAMVVGGLYLAKLLWSLISIIYRFTVYETDWKRKWGAGTSSWAVVTGSTDGIGEEFALQLAKKGYHILLVSRSQEKLEATQQRIKSASPNVQTEIFSLDFSSASRADFAALGAAVASKSVRVLVNNVGVGYPYPEYLHLQEEKVLRDLQTVNIASMIEVTRLVAPSMIEAYKTTKQRSLVLNIGSFSHLGAPLLGVYAGSKAFVYAFSKSIRADYGPLGVDVVQFNPLFITTKLAKVQKSNANLFTPTPEKWVRSALRVTNDKSADGLGGYLFHDLAYFFLGLLPESLVQNRTLAMHKGLRARAYKKFEKQDPLSRK